MGTRENQTDMSLTDNKFGATSTDVATASGPASCAPLPDGGALDADENPSPMKPSGHRGTPSAPRTKRRGRPRPVSSRRVHGASASGATQRREPARRVILIYDASQPFDIKVIQGVADFVRTHPGWRLFFHEGADAVRQPPHFEGWPADGVICSCRVAGIATGNRDWGVPVVAFGGTWSDNAACDACLHCVAADQIAVGRLGAEHLLKRGFRQLAFCGYGGNGEHVWSAKRAEAFTRRATEAAVPCETFSPDGASAPWPTLHQKLAEWLGTLPRPVGLMAANDRRARQIIEACHHLGLSVPEDVAVLGVDDDPVICELCQPTISSIDQSGRRIGRDAAELLSALMRGEPHGRGPRVVQPGGISERRSTDIIAVQDKLAAAALALVRSRACEGIKIADVADALAISRSTLQTRFKHAVGRTIHDEMRRVRIDTARRLLSDTDTPIKQVADQSGFRTVQHLTAVFRQVMGITPARYREEARLLRGSIQ